MTGANFWSLLGSRNMLYKYFCVCLFVRKQAGGQDFQGPALGIVKRYVLSYISYIISYREVSVCLFGSLFSNLVEKYSLLFSAIHIVRCYSIFCTTRWYSIVHNSTGCTWQYYFKNRCTVYLQYIVDSGRVVGAICTVFVVCTVYVKCVG